MVTPEQFLEEFKVKFPNWNSFQGNNFKSIRESWVVANFLRTYNKFHKLNYVLPMPSQTDSVPDIKNCIDSLNNKNLNFEIGEVLLDGAARAEKYKNLTDEPLYREIESNPEVIKIVRSNFLSLLRDKLLRNYGKDVFLLLYFNPSTDAGEELFFDKEKFIEGFIKEGDFVKTIETNKIFQEIWLLTGRMKEGYSQIICVYPKFKII